MADKRAESERRRASRDRRDSPTIPGVHAAHLAELVRRWGATSDELLGPLGLDLQSLADPASRLTIPMLERLVARARELTGEPGLGYYLGIAMRLSAHGFLGMACMAAGSLRDSLVLSCRFAATRSTAIEVRVEERDDRAYIVFDERCSFGSASDVVMTALMLGFWQTGNAMTGKELTGDAELAFPEPPYAERFAKWMPGEVRFGEPAHRLVFDRKLLDLPLVMSDPDALRLATDQCERELDRVGFQRSFVARARAALGATNRELPSLDALAAELGTSARTLKRKLADEGTAYSELVDELQRSRAITLMRSELTVDEIAARLGYSDAANFTRAFRRWTGESPREYRKK